MFLQYSFLRRALNLFTEGHKKDSKDHCFLQYKAVTPLPFPLQPLVRLTLRSLAKGGFILDCEISVADVSWFCMKQASASFRFDVGGLEYILGYTS